MLLVALGFLTTLALFVLAIAPVVADQVAALTKNAPAWFDELLHNRQIERWDQEYDIVSKAQEYVTSGKITGACSAACWEITWRSWLLSATPSS